MWYNEDMKKMSLREHRIRCGLRTEEVAVRLGIAHNTVYRQERGMRAPSGPLLQDYAALYGCDANDIDLTPYRTKAAA
jgi:DNA-binding XRE family transcriptional regulator